MKYPFFYVSIALSAVLPGCAVPNLKAPPRLDFERSAVSQAVQIGLESGKTKPQGLQITPMPETPSGRTTNARTEPTPEATPQIADITVNFDQLTIAQFIQAVYGQILKKNVAVDAAVNARTDLITFRTARAQTKDQLTTLSKMLLKSYGIAVQDFEGLVRIVPDTAASAYSPQIRRGRALPDVPQQLRPIFHLVELETVRTSDVSQWLRAMFAAKIQVTDDTTRNALLVSGAVDDVNAALEVIQILDRPPLRGSRARKLTPVFWSAEEFAKRLTELLQAQGYAAGTAAGANLPVLLLPVPAINSVMVFASNDEVLQLVLRWAQELDKPATTSSGGMFFTYPVKYADANDLAKVLRELMSAGTATPAAAPAPTVFNAGLASSPTPPPQAAPAAGASNSNNARVVVNIATNSLVIQGGKADDYRQWISLLAELDRPTRSALVEVVVAEVRLVGSQTFGVEWVLNQLRGSSGSITGGTLGGLGVPRTGEFTVGTNGVASTGGFTLNFNNSAGVLRGLLNMLASNTNARILSSPKIMARNGETATIQVGQEVPVITSQQSNSNTAGGVLQTVQYRNTGVILKVRPIIHSSSRLDLEVSQEVSEAGRTQTGVTSSPTISTRKVDTKLTLRDGSTVLLAGLIRSTANETDTGIPWVKDVPFFGNLFKSGGTDNDRTELIVLITPYVINDEYEAESLTEAFKNTLGDWSKEVLPKQPLLKRSTPPTEPQSSNKAAPSTVSNGASPNEVMPDNRSQPSDISPNTKSLRNEQNNTAPRITDGVEFSKPLTPSDASTALPGAATQSIPAKNNAEALKPEGAGKVITDEALLRELRRSLEPKK